MRHDQDYFERYLERFPDTPSLVLVRSAELKNYPKEFIRHPVLDVCCGDGFFMECLGLEGVHGCDINVEALTKARALKRTYSVVKECDARRLESFDDRSFATVLSNCALEHVDGIDSALSSIARVLKIGGHLIMSVPGIHLTDWFFPKRVFEAMGMPFKGKCVLDRYNTRLAHINILSLEEWDGLLESVDLRIEKAFYLFGPKAYMFATFCDALNWGSMRRLYSVTTILPISLRKYFWRRVLRPLYERLSPLDQGGELLIVAKRV